MITKIFEIITRTDGSVKEIDKLNKSLESTDKSIEQVNDGAKDIGVNLKALPNATKKIAGGFRMMGTALKAAGIGLAIAAFTTLKELFSQQQVIVDAFKVSFEMLSLAFTDFFKYISQNVGTISGYFKSLFDDPKAAVMDLVDSIENYLIHFLDKTLEYFGFLAKGFAKLVTGDFSGAMDDFKSGLNAGVDAITGVDDTVKKVNDSFDAGVKALGEYTISTYKQAKSNVELAKTAELAAVANQGLIEKYDRQAEQQRQIRDDERKSIEERKKANDELGLILEKQEKAMLANAQISLRAAQVELKKDKNNIEFKKRVMEAENELAAVRATVTGFRSEQQTNEAALEKEGLELIKSRLESENNLSIERKRFVAEQIKDERERLLEQQRIDAEEADLGRTRLTNEIALYKEGTQAKVDAEIALAEFEEQIYQQKVNRSNELTALETANDTQSRQVKVENQKRILDATSSALSSIAQIVTAKAGEDEKQARKAFNVNKGLGIAQAVINTGLAVTAALTAGGNPIKLATGAQFVEAGIAALAGAAQIATITATQFNPSGGGGASTPSTSISGGASEPQAPSFNVVGQSGFNQVAGALGQQPPVQAYVVAGNVTTAQQLQNNTIQQATF